MKRYVLVFLFDESMENVLLIRKSRKPFHHIGKLNGLGGGIEEGETPKKAAIREIGEEAMVPDPKMELHSMAYMHNCNFEVFVYWSTTHGVSFNHVDQSHTREGRLEVWNVGALTAEQCVCNVCWLVQMALDRDTERGLADISYDGNRHFEHDGTPV